MFLTPCPDYGWLLSQEADTSYPFLQCAFNKKHNDITIANIMVNKS